MTEDVFWQTGSVTRAQRASLTGGLGATVWLTGLSGSGKSTIAHAMEAELIARKRAAYVLDGDNIRHGLNSDLGFTFDDREENVRRVGEVARLMSDAGFIAIVPLISPYRVHRIQVRAQHEAASIRFIEVYVDTPLEVCEERDPKGLYARARAGELSGFTGIDDPYEPPAEPDVHLAAASFTIAQSVHAILSSVMASEGASGSRNAG